MNVVALPQTPQGLLALDLGRGMIPLHPQYDKNKSKFPI